MEARPRVHGDVVGPAHVELHREIEHPRLPALDDHVEAGGRQAREALVERHPVGLGGGTDVQVVPAGHGRDEGDPKLEAQIGIDKWVYEVGLPDNAVHVKSAAFPAVDALAEAYSKGGPAPAADGRL